MTGEQAFAWYSGMAKHAGWRDYVREQAKALASEHPVLYADLWARLAAAFPVLTQSTVQSVRETRANTYRLERSRFQIAQPVQAKKGKRNADR